MVVMKGADISAKLKEEILTAGKGWKESGICPKLAIVRVGERPDDLSYERSALKKMASLGLEATAFSFPSHISHQAFRAKFLEINQDPSIHGILLLRPLPKQIDEREIETLICPKKDLDGISPINIAKVFAGDGSGFAPCTAEAVVEVLKGYQIPLAGKRVTVIGRSMVVGRPLSMLLLRENATVTICHTKTKDLPATCQRAEILVAAAGKARMVTEDYLGDHAIVIDVGIHVDDQGKLCGDVDFESIKDKASMATPVPGGVGAVTTMILARHLARAAKDNW